MKAEAGHRSNLVGYIATRDGVELSVNHSRTLSPTKKQIALIENILRDASDAESLLEHEDYTQNPTRQTASAFITRALEEVMGSESPRDIYIKYISERPRVELRGLHGLFSDSENDIVLSRVQKEIMEHTGNVWTPIISLRREDAVRLGYDDAAQWQAMLCSFAAELAEGSKISPDNFRWYAAFHKEETHPHIHMVCYSINPREGFLTERGIERIKSSLASYIFRQDLQHIYEQKNDRYRELTECSTELLKSLCENIFKESGYSSHLEELLLNLSVRLSNTGGKKVYGYLKADVKNLVDEIVDELAENDAVAKCYTEWHRVKNQMLQIYKSDVPEAPPLSHVKEFKKIKNAVIAEAVRLGGFSFSEQNISDIDDAPESEIEPAMLGESEFVEDSSDDYGVNANWSKKYKQARSFLFGNKKTKPDFERAHELFLQQAQSGNALAMHDLGRMYTDGLGVGVDEEVSFEWYEKALSAFLKLEKTVKPKAAVYLQYRIGKMYMLGIGTEQDYEKAAKWLAQAAAANNKYAQYSLAGLYYRGQGVEQSFEKAFSLYGKSAEAGNAYAAYELAKMYRDGIGTAKDLTQADINFRDAYAGFTAMEARSGDDRLQYRLGQMCRDGVGTDVNPELAEDYFARSAKLNNENAQYALAKIYLKKDDSAKIAQALEWLEKLAEKDVEYVQYTLGKLYLDGEAVPQDIDRAIELLTKSAAQNNQFAQYQLGKIYIMGKLVPRDRETALYWFGLSAVQGNEYAQFFIDHIDEIGIRNPDIFMSVTSLFGQVESIFNEQTNKLEAKALQLDQKRRKILREKKLAQGHARDEQIQNY